MEADYWRAVKEGDAAALSRLLHENPALVNSSDRHRKTGLHWAAELNHPEVAGVLLESGADLEARASWGASPLDWAAVMGGSAVAELLLARGASGLTLISSAGLGRLDDVRAIIQAGGDLSIHRRRDAPDAPDDHWPSDSAHILRDVLSDALYAAARNGHTEVVRYLLSQRADVNAKGVFGATGLHWAAINGWTSTVELLLASGANPAIRDKRFDGYPDDWVYEGGHAHLVERLRAARLSARGE